MSLTKKTIIAIGAVLVLLSTGIRCGVSISSGERKVPESCPMTGQPHVWGRWIDDWKEPNDFGYMNQRRYCDDCGRVEFHLFYAR